MDELREKIVEILASCLSDNDVKPRTEEVFDAFKEAGWINIDDYEVVFRKLDSPDTKELLKGVGYVKLEELLEWAIIIRKKLQEKKNERNKIKPHDIQALAVLGGKIKAFQQVIDKLNYRKEGE